MKGSLTAVILILILLIQGAISGQDEESTQDEGPSRSSSSRYYPYPENRISIEGNDELREYIEEKGFTGNGTKEDPYVIRDMVISSDHTFHDGIRMDSVSDHLLIKNITIENMENGMEFDYCSNFIIEDCQIDSCYRGIMILISEGDISISGLKVSSCDIPIYVCNTGEVDLENIEIFDCFTGIYLKDIDQGISINDTRIYGRHIGIKIESTGYCELHECLIENCLSNGIDISSSETVDIGDCMINNCKEAGIRISNSRYIAIKRSTIEGNGYAGFSIRESDGINISECDFFDTGIDLDVYNIQYKDVSITNNRINGKKLIFKLNEDLDDWNLPENTGQVLLYFCKNISMVGGTFSEIEKPLDIQYCYNVTLNGTLIAGNDYCGCYILHGAFIHLENCIFAENEGYGAIIENCNEFDLMNCHFLDNAGGLYLGYSTSSASINSTDFRGNSNLLDSSHRGDLVLTNNTFRSDGRNGVSIRNSPHLRLENNSFTGSGVSFPNPFMEETTHSNNTVNGKNLLFLEKIDMKNMTLDSDPGQVILHNVKNLVISNLVINGSFIGIHTYSSFNVRILNSSISGCRYGLSSYNSDNCRLGSTSIDRCGYGIKIEDCQGTNMVDCNVSNNIGWTEFHINSGFSDHDGNGIYCVSSSGYINNSRLENNHIGIIISGSSPMNVFNCNITNGMTGIELGSCYYHGRIEQNRIFDAEHDGILIRGSGFDIRNNDLLGCSFGIEITRSVFDPGLSESNTVNGKPILYRYKSNLIENGNGGRGQYIAVDCENVRISNISMKGGTNSISALFCRNLVIEKNSFERDGESMRINWITDVRISENQFLDSSVGIHHSTSDYSDNHMDIFNNIFISCKNGFSSGDGYSYHCSVNFYENLFYECHSACQFSDNQDIEFFNNDVIGTKGPVFGFEEETPFIYSNNFFYNNGTTTRWDKGSYQGIQNDAGLWRIRFYDPDQKYNRRGNYWTDSDWLDIDMDGVVDRSHVVDIGPDGSKVRDENPLTEPEISRHIIMRCNQTNEMINLTWELPEYTFLGAVQNVILYRQEEGLDPVNMGSFSPENRNYSTENTGDGSECIYYATPIFSEGEGYPSNPVTVVHDNNTPIVRITNPKNGTMYNNDRPEISFQWEVKGIELDLVSFMVRPNEGSWDDCDNKTIWGYWELPYPRYYSNWKDGWNSFEVRGTDYLGRTFNDTVHFLIDDYGPQIKILSPINNAEVYTGYVTVKWEVRDELLEIRDTHIRMDGGEWINVTGGTEYTFEGVIEGTYTIRIQSNDTIGNMAERSINILVIHYFTPIEITYPYRDELINRDEVEIEWYTGNPAYVQSSFISIDEGPWQKVENMGKMLHFFEEDGNHSIRMKSVNLAGREFLDNISFRIDTTKPSVIEHYPIGTNVAIDTPIFLEFSEEMNITSLNIYVNEWVAQPQWQENRAYCNYPYEFHFGEEVWIDVRGKDLAGNEMEPFTYTFTITDIGTVKGRAVDEWFNPVKGARVLFDNGDETITGSDGTFQVSIPEGDYRILVEKEGHLSAMGYVECRAGGTSDTGDLILETEPEEEREKDNPIMMVSLIISSILLVSMIIMIVVFVRKRGYLLDFEE